MKRPSFFKLLSIISFATFVVLTGCDSDKSDQNDSAIQDPVENTVPDIENTAKEVVTAINKAEQLTAETSHSTIEVVNTATTTDTTVGYTVKMLNNGKDGMMVFEPAFLKVEKGATVTFVATDAGHDSVSAYIPDGGIAWKGKNSKDITVTLEAEGVYLYKCTPHAMMGMVGVIQVGEVTNMADAKKAAAELTSAIAMNKNRLADAMAEIK